MTPFYLWNATPGMAIAQSLAFGGALALSIASAAAEDFEPKLTFRPQTSAREVALTLDACAGRFDYRILDALVETRSKATIFVTARWMLENPGGVKVLRANRQLFEIENHGAMHVPAVTDAAFVFGIRTAATPAGVRAEVEGGGRAIGAAFERRPEWFRGATARYSGDAIEVIERARYRVAGYSVNADKGASLPAAEAERRMAGANPGDVIIAHINQPRRPAGVGIAAGVRALAASGARFVWLSEVDAKEENFRPVVNDDVPVAAAPMPKAPGSATPPASIAKSHDDRPLSTPVKRQGSIPAGKPTPSVAGEAQAPSESPVSPPAHDPPKDPRGETQAAPDPKRCPGSNWSWLSRSCER